MRQMRIFVMIDDHSFRGHLESILSLEPDLHFVGGAPAAPAALNSMHAAHADLIVIDAKATGLLRRAPFSSVNGNGTKPKVLLIGTAGEEAAILRALDVVVCGYLPQDSSRAQIVSEIRAAFRGGHYLTANGTCHLIADPDSHGFLTHTQTRVD